MLKMVADESCKGSVYGLDVQEAALQKTSSLLEESVSPSEVPFCALDVWTGLNIVSIS